MLSSIACYLIFIKFLFEKKCSRFASPIENYKIPKLPYKNPSSSYNCNISIQFSHSEKFGFRKQTMAWRSVRISLFFLVCFLIGSISYASSAEAEAEPSELQAQAFVVTLDHSNFTDFVSRQKFIIVEFYAPW